MKTIIMEKAREYLNSGWHCSEGILLAVGETYLDEINPGVLRSSTAFAGGVGGRDKRGVVRGACGRADIDQRAVWAHGSPNER